MSGEHQRSVVKEVSIANPTAQSCTVRKFRKLMLVFDNHEFGTMYFFHSFGFSV